MEQSVKTQVGDHFVNHFHEVLAAEIQNIALIFPVSLQWSFSMFSIYHYYTGFPPEKKIKNFF
jgi:hypothetical protein